MNNMRDIMILVHPGSACGSADFNLGHEAGPLREALAAEINAWPHDLMIVDGELSEELNHYALLGLVIENAMEKGGRKVVREKACDLSVDNWPQVVLKRFRCEWPGGPHRVSLTGAWYGEDGHGCVNAVSSILSDQQVDISPNAFRL